MPMMNRIKPWLAVEAIPIVALVAGAVSTATYCTIRAAMGPTIQWTSKNPAPWNTIEQDQGTKMMQINQKFDKTWHRSHV